MKLVELKRLTADLKRLTQIWQERLKCLDWDITVRFCTKEEADGGYGFCYPLAEQKSARILIAPPDTYSEETKNDKTKDVEVFIVHELLHLSFAPFQNGEGADGITEENIVNMVSRLLIAAIRKKDIITGRRFTALSTFETRPTKLVKEKDTHRTKRTKAKKEEASTADDAGSNSEVREGAEQRQQTEVQSDAS